MAAQQSPEFTTAAEHSRKLLAKPTNDELLNLYALYKEGLQDPPFAEAPSPGMFDLKGKAKYNKWKEIAEENMGAEEAQKRYVDQVERLKAKYGFDENKVPEPVGGN